MASPELGTESIFDVRIGVDDKNPDAYAVFIRQSGLGLPDRDYYRLDEKGIVETREKYRAYIAEILRLGDVADAEATAKAEAIFKLETDIADDPLVARGPARRRQDLQSHARVRIGALRARFPLGGDLAGERNRRSRRPANAR